jgi:hypothetical protein
MSTNHTRIVSLLFLLLAAAILAIQSAHWDPVELRRAFIRQQVATSLNRLNIPASSECLDSNLAPQFSVRHSLIIAFIAAENFARPPFIRWIELQYASLSLMVRGRIPDISLGIGQFRTSALPLIASRGIPSIPLDTPYDQLRAFGDPCSSSLLTATYIQTISRRFSTPVHEKPAFVQLAKIYNGQRTETPQNILYRDIVWEIYVVLQSCLDSATLSNNRQLDQMSQCVHETTAGSRGFP